MLAVRLGSVLAAVLVASLSTTHAIARTWHIQADGTGDAPTIQAGIDSSATGDTVLVHDGTYTGPGNKDLSFGGKAIVLMSASGPAATVIDCEGSGRGIYIGGEGYDPTVEGLTIRGGSADGGGGICVEAAATIRNCWILDCTSHASGNGGAILSRDALVRVYDCLISGNSATQGGGGILVWRGGGDIRRSVIVSNASAWGAGVACYGSYGLTSLDSCLVSGNFAAYSGGGIGLGSDDFLALTLRHTTVAGNGALVEGGGVAGGSWDNFPLQGQMSIIWGNCAPYAAEGLAQRGLFILDSCDVDTSGLIGSCFVVNSIAEDPLFCRPADCLVAPTTAGDYTLDAASPCLPQNNPWGQWGMGALGQGCDGGTSVAVSPVGEGRDPVLSVSPNPSRGAFTVRYGLPSTTVSSLAVFDIAGRLVRVLDASGTGGASIWDGKDGAGREAAPGVYFVRVTARDYTDTRRIILVR